MPPTVFCVTGPFGQVVYGRPWSLPVGSGFEEPDPRKFSGSLRAEAHDYGAIRLSWTLPGGNIDIDRVAVVRGGYGMPVGRFGGVTVYEGATDAPVLSTVDVGLFAGRWFYYSLFVHEAASDRWVRAGTADCIAVRDWGYHDSLWRTLPTIYRTFDRQLASSVQQGPLYRLLKIFAFEFDLLRSLAGNVEQARNIEDVSARLLEHLAIDLGTPYEIVLGDMKMRGILDAIIRWRKEKGTVEALDDLVQTIASCADAHVEMVPNRLLDHNDSGWDEPTIGRWTDVDNATLARSTTTPSPRSSAGYLTVTADADGDIVFSNAEDDAITTQGIRVEPGQIYCASIYTRSDGVDRPVAMEIEWFDRNGDIASASSPANTDVWGPTGQVVHGQINPYGTRGPFGSGGSATPSVVSEFAGPNNDTDWETRIHIARAAPLDARFARMVVTVEDALTGESHHFDEAQFEEADSPTPFEPARKVLVYACGVRTNKVLNPAFEVNALGWSGVNTALTIDATDARFGTKSLRLEPLTPGAVSASTVVDVDPEKFYAFSMYLKPLDADTLVTMAVEWLDADNNVLRTHGSNDLFVSDGNWKRAHVFDAGPVGAVSAMFSLVAYPQPGEQVRVDAALVETGNVMQDYFDGSFAGLDYSWAGAAHASPSIFIENREIYESVLGRYLDEYVPATTPWEIVFTA